ncbi:MAG: ornithine carbamoyltransferase [Acidobacteria bacterium]|nr:ornithine carbamoyltransferase [Acidobacteriota bacterium]
MSSKVLQISTRSAERPAKTLWWRDLISIRDLAPKDVEFILELAALIKSRPAEFRTALAGKQVALFFEKPSLRTRLTFEAGISSMGGTTFFIDQTGSRIDAREPLSDIAHNLERWVDGVVLRTFAHSTASGMAEHACIPVVNALTDHEHPCQALADYFTLQEKFGDVKKIRLAYVGDGNNVAHSLMLTAAALGSTIRVAAPPGYEPDPEVTGSAVRSCAKTGGSVEVTHDPIAAVTNADAIYTDVWASMGQEAEAAERRKVFAAYQVNEALFAHAAPHAVFMHCLPAHRGEEVTAEVIDSSRAIVFDQAENRLHVQKAILLLLVGNGLRRFPKRSAHA